jgi:hypothetical protein
MSVTELSKPHPAPIAMGKFRIILADAHIDLRTPFGANICRPS